MHSDSGPVDVLFNVEKALVIPQKRSRTHGSNGRLIVDPPSLEILPPVAVNPSDPLLTCGDDNPIAGVPFDHEVGVINEASPIRMGLSSGKQAHPRGVRKEFKSAALDSRQDRVSFGSKQVMPNAPHRPLPRARMVRDITPPCDSKLSGALEHLPRRGYPRSWD